MRPCPLLLAACLTFALLAPAIAVEPDKKPHPELKWAQGIANDFLNAVATGQMEQAEGLIGESFRESFEKRGKAGLREWLATNAAVKTLPGRKITEAELSPDENEVLIVGDYQFTGQDVSLSLRLNKQGEKGPWRVSFFNLTAKQSPPTLKKRPTATEIAEPLLGKLPEDFVVSAVCVTQGPKTSDAQLVADGSTTYLCDVVVNQPKQNVVLVVSAYAPTIWQIGRTSETNIVGVIVTGYKQQAVLGLDRRIPQAASTNAAPGDFRSFFESSSVVPDRASINRFVLSVLGKEATEFGRLSSDGTFFVGAAPKDGVEIVRAKERKLEDVTVKGSLPPQDRGLEQLTKEGKIRLATQEDIDEWFEKWQERNPTAQRRDRDRFHIHIGRTYVILEETPLPPGLYGGHSRGFIIPPNIPIHAATKQHNTYYILDGTTTAYQGR